MEHLFAALRELHPGHEVVDVRFSVDPTERCDLDVAQVDIELGHAVRNARMLDVGSLTATLGLR